MSDAEQIQADAARRGITRLAHFTPLRNLVHIGTSTGIRSTKHLSEHDRSEFNPQDLSRLDGHPDHISCSIEYPSAYYLRSKVRNARGEDRLFPDWVCLFLDAHHLWGEKTLLCPHNAAGGRGAHVAGGFEVFTSLFADVVSAPQGDFRRSDHERWCPTDAQAEVLVHRLVPFEDIIGIAVMSADKAAETWASLVQLESPLAETPFVVAPDLFAPGSLYRKLASGERPVESEWHAPAGVGVDGDSNE